MIQHGRSPLLIAAAAGHTEVCEILLRHNVDVNTPDNVSQFIIYYFKFVFIFLLYHQIILQMSKLLPIYRKHVCINILFIILWVGNRPINT